MIFGIQYERYPNPPAQEWRRDLTKIREMGFDFIRTWLYWRKVNPAEGEWDFSHYDQLLGIAHECGLKVQIQLFAEAPPEFLVREHPQWRYQNREGEFEKIIRRAAQQIGGFQGFDYSNPEPRARAEEYIRRVAQRYRTHPALMGYDAWNELWMSQWLDSPWIVPERAAFLKKKYIDIHTLNRAYVETFRSFEEVEDPRIPEHFGIKKVMNDTYIDHMDALEFENDLGEKMLLWRTQTLRRYDDAHPVAAHIGGASAEHLLAKNSWQFGKAVDEWGVSEHLDSLNSFLLSMHACRDTSQGKPWWLAENGSGGIWTNLNSVMRSADFLLSTITMAAMLGAYGVVFWQYRPEICGMESPNFGLVKLNGNDTVRSLETARMLKTLKEKNDLLGSVRFDDDSIALVYSPAAGIMDRVNKTGFYQDFCGWHSALTQRGCLPRIIRDTDLLEEIPDPIRLIILPMEVVETPGLRERLLVWVREGGVLAASGQTFLFDRYMMAQREYPGADLFGANENESDRYDGDVMLLDPVAGPSGFPSGGRRIHIELKGAAPVGVIENEPAVTLFRLGKGKSFWFGCAPGRACGFGEYCGLSQPVGMLLREAGIAPAAEASGGVVVRVGKLQGGRRILYAVNLSGKGVYSWILIRGGSVTRAEDIVYGQIEYDGCETDRFPVHFEPDQSKIMILDA